MQKRLWIFVAPELRNGGRIREMEARQIDDDSNGAKIED
jgi:hypothetical protein